MLTCLEGDGDVLPPVHLHHGSPASLQLLHDRAVQGLLFYPVTHVLKGDEGHRWWSVWREAERWRRDTQAERSLPPES